MQQTVRETLSFNRSVIAEAEKTDGPATGVKTYKWTHKEYGRMAELGFFEGKRVELIEGEIIEMSPMNKPHATSIRLLLQILKAVFIENYVVDSQLPMSFGKINEPEPDIAVIKGQIRDFSKSHPSVAELIIEVSDSTLQFDRLTKASLYAHHNINDYWILNLRDRTLEVYRQPKKDKKLGYLYTEKLIFTEDDYVSPLAAPEASIKIADILP